MLPIELTMGAKQFEYYDDLSGDRTTFHKERPPITCNIDAPISIIQSCKCVVMKERVKWVSTKELESLCKGRTDILICLAVLLAEYFIVPDVHSGIEHWDHQARQ